MHVPLQDPKYCLRDPWWQNAEHGGEDSGLQVRVLPLLWVTGQLHIWQPHKQDSVIHKSKKYTAYWQAQLALAGGPVLEDDVSVMHLLVRCQ
jgi:hypothetical protein